MKRIAVVFISIALLLLTLFSALAVRINEIMYNPEGDDNNKEWIELYSEDEEIDLTNWTIGDNVSNDSLVLLKYDNSNYLLIVEDGSNFSSIPAKIYSVGAAIGNGLGNNGDVLYLYDANKTLIDYVAYNNTFANENNKSLEFFNGSWYESLVDGGTPGIENSIFYLSNNQTNSSNETNTINITKSAQLCDPSILIKTEKDVYKNGESIKFRHILSNISGTFKIEYWIEDLLGNIAKAKRTTENLNEKSYTPKINEKEKAFVIKSVLKVDCDINEANNIAEKLISVINKDFEESSENNEVSKFEYEIIQYPEIIVSEKEFSILVRIKGDSQPHLISISSYIYRYSKHYSENVSEEITLDRNEETVIELNNTAHATPGEYKLKIKIKKDSLKTEYELSKNVTIVEEEKNDFGINNSNVEIISEVKNTADNETISNDKTIEKMENHTIVYKSESVVIKDWIKYAIIAFLAIVSAILIWRR